MIYDKLAPEAQAQILDNTILQLEADHFRAQLAKDMAPSPEDAARADALMSDLDARLAKLKAKKAK